MQWIWRAIRRRKENNAGKWDAGYTLVELIIGITITFLLSVGVFQLIRIGYKAISSNADSASQNGFSSTFSALYNGDISHSDGFVVSSATSTTDKANLCSSWSPSTDPGFSKIRPLFTVSVSHTASIKSLEAWQNSTNSNSYTNTYIFTMLDIPDFTTGEILRVTGFTAFDVAARVTSTLDFNITADKGLKITSINPESKTVTVQDTQSDVLLTSTHQFFTSTTSALAQTNSYSGYELRAPLSSSGSATSSEMWRVICPSLGQQSINLKASVRLRTGLPQIDTRVDSACSENGVEKWTDWSCAIRCPQFTSADLGSNFKANSDVCPKDVFISIGQGSFVATTSASDNYASKTTLNASTNKYESTLYIVNLNRNVSNIRQGMSVDFPTLYDANGVKKSPAFVTAVDLTDATYAIVTISCGVDPCPVLPGLNMKVVVGASIAIECASTPCSTSTALTQVIDVQGTNQVKQGMYANVSSRSNPDFAVVGDLSKYGVQQLLLDKSPIFSNYPAVKILEFSQPIGLQLWIPAAGVGSKLSAEKFNATRSG